MGLDMYAYSARFDPSKPVDFNDEIPQDDDSRSEIMYWRKHPNLHGWMQSLYRAKGGEAESFNCVPVQLTLQDLDQLDRDIRNGDLPRTSGFFFGTSSEDAEELNEDLKFVDDARRAINEGQTVWYDSWW